MERYEVWEAASAFEDRHKARLNNSEIELGELIELLDEATSSLSTEAHVLFYELLEDRVSSYCERRGWHLDELRGQPGSCTVWRRLFGARQVKNLPSLKG